MTMSQVQSIPDPEVKAIADEVVQVARLAAEKATLASIDPASYKLAGGKSSFESILSRRFADLDPAQRVSAEANMSARWLGQRRLALGSTGALRRLT